MDGQRRDQTSLPFTQAVRYPVTNAKGIEYLIVDLRFIYFPSFLPLFISNLMLSGIRNLNSFSLDFLVCKVFKFSIKSVFTKISVNLSVCSLVKELEGN